ncbi:MAG: dUTP diphosphatase [Oscillospiraceae bacterium]|nr:dUTP diphosphatase [Oscillospiraceae bacterium]
MEKLPVKLLRKSAKAPLRQTGGSVGYDISACVDDDVIIQPGETFMIGSGFAIALQQGYAAFLYARSGLGIKQGIIPANCVGVVDSDYRGEVIVGLRNTSQTEFTVKNGDRIAQMVIKKCELPEIVICDDLDDTLRGDGGFGSTDNAKLRGNLL